MEANLLEPLANREETQLALKELKTSKGWRILQAHLEWQCKKREKVQRECVRQQKFHEAVMQQGYLDCLNFVIGEVDNLINRLNQSQPGEEGEQQ